MGLLDTLRSKLGQNPDKAAQGIDKAAAKLDKKTGGKHRKQVDDVARKAKKNLGAREEEHPQAPPEAGPGGPPADPNPGEPPPR